MSEEDILLRFKQGEKTAEEILAFYGRLNAKEQAYPLSVAQLGLWILYNAQPQSSAYNIPMCLTYQGALDNQRLYTACRYLIKQYPVLSNIIVDEEGEQPMQTSLASSMLHASTLDYVQSDVSGLSEEQIQHALTESVKQPFNLTEGPLIRFRVFSQPEKAFHYVMIVVHHMVFDGSSYPIVVKTVSEAYHKLSCGEPLEVSKAVAGYKDYVIDQDFFLKSQKAKDCQSYWQKQLANSLPNLMLSLEKKRLGALPEGATHTRILGTQESQRISDFCLAQKINCSVFFLTLFKILLHKHSDQTDILVGMPTMGRKRPEFYTMIGYFVNMLAIRSGVHEDTTVEALLKQVQDTMIDALDHDAYPFQKLVEDLNVPLHPGEPPIFQVAFIYQNNSLALSALKPGQASEAHPVFGMNQAFQQEGEYKLQLDIIELEHTFSVNLKYDRNRFDEDVIDLFMGHYLQLIDACISDATHTLAQVSFMSPTEKHTLLHQWNNTEQGFPRNTCLHELFEQQAKDHAQATALMHEENRVSYAELNTRANQLAHYLRGQRKVNPGQPVGVCLPRSVDMVVGLLAVLKAGGGYVPLDPYYPAQRITYMVKDAQLDTVITLSSLCEKAGLSSDIALCLDAGQVQSALKQQPQSNIASSDIGLTSQSLSYIIYTSGSTGDPKGVMITHKNALALLTWVYSEFSEEQTRCMSASASVCFDLSVFELFTPLCRGGAALIVENTLELHTSPYKGELTFVNAVPSAAEALLADQGFPPSASTIILAGEPLKQSLVDRIYETGVDKLYDMYGPSEDTTYSTYCLRRYHGKPRIGQPIGNCKAYVADNNLRLQPIGIAGELCLSGEGLSLGYLNKPELTQEKFIDNPFYIEGQDECYRRLYRTGDLVRWLPEGQIEYLGRIDHQVQVHGFRIELGEIEHVLMTHEHIKDCVVTATTLSQEDNALVAYCVCDTPQAESTDAIKVFLSQVLPRHMVPSYCIFLPRLPLNPNGKVDRKALPAPDIQTQEKVYIAPKTAEERAFAELWEETLGVNKVGVTDNFFDIGGNSMTAIKLALSVQSRFGRKLDFRHIIQFPTIELLLNAFGQTQESDEIGDANITQFREGADTPLFLTHSLVGNTLHFTEFCHCLSDNPPDDLAIYGLELSSKDPEHPVLSSMQALARHHIEVMRQAQPSGPYRLAGFSFGGVLAYEIAAQLLDENEEVEYLGLLDASKPSDEMAFILNEKDEQILAKGVLELFVHHFNPALNLEDIKRHLPENNNDIAALLTEVKRQQLMPAEFTLESLLSMSRVRQRLAQIHYDYVPQRLSLEIPVHLVTSEEGLKQKGEWLDWEDVKGLDWTSDNIPGTTHLSLTNAPYSNNMADAVSVAIQHAQDY